MTNRSALPHPLLSIVVPLYNEEEGIAHLPQVGKLQLTRCVPISSVEKGVADRLETGFNTVNGLR